jgi:hypothetical protein
LVRGDEAVIESAATGEEVAWSPLSGPHRDSRPRTHPSGRLWTLNDGNYLALFTLEGEREA